MNSATSPANIRPWYREPWPWMLMSLPLTAIVAGLITWAIAHGSNDGLVAQDYYKKGLEINRDLARQEQAVNLGLSADLRLEGRRIVVVLASKRELAAVPLLRLSLLNPARAGLDQVLSLKRDGDRYVAEADALRDGRWNVKLEDEGRLWQLFAEASLPLKGPLELKP